MTQPEQSNIEVIVRTTMRGVHLRRSEGGLFIKPPELDGEGEFSLSLEELGQALRVLGYNRADVFPEG